MCVCFFFLDFPRFVLSAVVSSFHKRGGRRRRRVLVPKPRSFSLVRYACFARVLIRSPLVRATALAPLQKAVLDQALSELRVVAMPRFPGDERPERIVEVRHPSPNIEVVLVPNETAAK